MKLVVRVVVESLHYKSGKVFPDFEPDPRFNPVWWRNGSAKSPVSYCQFMEEGVEVGRAKILPGSRSYTGYLEVAACPASRRATASAGYRQLERPWPHPPASR